MKLGMNEAGGGDRIALQEAATSLSFCIHFLFMFVPFFLSFFFPAPTAFPVDTTSICFSSSLPSGMGVSVLVCVRAKDDCIAAKTTGSSEQIR